jgi:hypothetical protein
MCEVGNVLVTLTRHEAGILRRRLCTGNTRSKPLQCELPNFYKRAQSKETYIEEYIMDMHNRASNDRAMTALFAVLAQW